MSSILALDYGEKRIGLALASTEAKLPRPYRTLENNDQLLPVLQQIVTDEEVTQLVVGLPRGLDGQDTAQTAQSRAFADRLKDLQIPTALQDEAVTSEQARAELESRGKPYTKADIDALAATYILEDYLK